MVNARKPIASATSVNVTGSEFLNAFQRLVETTTGLNPEHSKLLLDLVTNTEAETGTAPKEAARAAILALMSCYPALKSTIAKTTLKEGPGELLALVEAARTSQNSRVSIAGSATLKSRAGSLLKYFFKNQDGSPRFLLHPEDAHHLVLVKASSDTPVSGPKPELVDPRTIVVMIALDLKSPPRREFSEKSLFQTAIADLFWVRPFPDIWFTIIHPGKPNSRNLTDVMSSIVEVANEMPQDWGAVIGVHVQQNVKELPNDVDRPEWFWLAIDYLTRKIVERNFEEYEGALPDSPNHAPIVLVTENVQRMLWHRFSFEPVGEEKANTKSEAKSPTRPVVFRAWSSISPAIVPQNVQDLVEKYTHDDTLNIEGKNKIVRIPVQFATCEQDVQDVARALIYRLEDSLAPLIHQRDVILHWQCTAERSTDLLRPVDESIGVLAGFIRRSRFKREEAQQDFDVDAVVADMLNNYVGPETCEKIAPTIKALLLGGQAETDFQEVLPHLVELLKAPPGRVRVVVECADRADELLVDLIERLGKNMPGWRDFRLYAVSSPKIWHELPPTLTKKLNVAAEKFPQDAAFLLEIAAVLGSDFRLTWLIDCWLGLNPGAPDSMRAFDAAFEACLRLGMLQFCDSLIERSGGTQFLPQLKWVGRAWQEFFRHSGGPKFPPQVIRQFAADLARIECDRSERIPVLRLKTRIFDILDLGRDRVATAPRFMADLGLLLGKRARRAGAHQEAVRRLAAALEWEKKIQPRSASAKVGLYIATELLLAKSSKQDFPSIDGLATDKYVSSVIDDLESMPPKGMDEIESHFALIRLCWSYEIWFANLARAVKLANSMQRLASYLPEQSKHLQFEASHALCVTLFAVGELSQTQEHAKRGTEYCIDTRHFVPKNPTLFGSHDGRVCCKLFIGICDLLINGLPGHQSAKEWLEKAGVFAESLGNDETKRIAKIYTALLHILLDQPAEAFAVCNSASTAAVHTQWGLMTNLLKLCSQVALGFEGNGSNLIPYLIQSFREHRTLRGIMEYETLWSTFEGVGHALQGDAMASDDAFWRVINLNRDRGEKVFVPLCYLWWARVKARGNRLDLAYERLDSGLAVAREIGSKFYEDKLLEQLQIFKSDSLRKIADDTDPDMFDQHV